MEEINKIIEKLLFNTNLGIILEAPIRVSGGLLNRMYKVITSTGIYAIKHLNPEVMKRENAKENHILAEQIANYAKDKGITCISAKIINGSALQEIEGNFFLIFDWFDGKALNENEVTTEQVKIVSALLAKLHSIDFDIFKNRCNLGKNVLETNWDYYLSKLENPKLKSLLMNNIKKLKDLDKKSTISANEIRNNLVVSHRDLDLPNILWDSKNNPVIIDWESSGLVNPCEELIETAWDWSGGQQFFDENKYKLFISNYKNCGGDISQYSKAIYANFKNKAGWLEYNLKRVCGIECIDEEEQKLGEKEVVRVIDEILMFYDCIDKIKII